MGNCCESKDAPRKPQISCCAEENGGKDPVETLRLRSDESDNYERPKVIKLHPVPVSSSNTQSLTRNLKEESISNAVDIEEPNEVVNVNTLPFKKDPNRISQKIQKISEIPKFLLHRIPLPSLLLKTITKINDQMENKAKSCSIYQYEDGLIYRGEMKNMTRHGMGEQIWPDGMYYIGSWLADQKDGLGRLMLPDGTVYEGIWNSGALNYGYIIKNEDVYEGYIFNGKKHGKGSMHWGDGKCYQGEWRNGIMHGKGSFTWKNGRSFVGEYKYGKKYGYGEFKWPNGKEYKGIWNGSNGEGICIFPDGSKSRVQWEEGKIVRELEGDVN